MTIPMILAAAVFVVSLFLILTEKLNRTIVAAAGAAVIVGLGLIFGFYTEEESIQAIDFETIGLLLGMMILVAMLEPTGFFQYVAIWASRLSRGKPVRLFVLLGAVTTILSMFLDNVTTVVLIAPITLTISSALGISAIPLLISEAILSNTGGVATLVGDPPNVLIGSAADLSFTDFLTHSLPVILFVWPVALLSLRFLFRKELDRPAPKAESILQLEPSQSLKDRPTVRRVLITLGAALILFFFPEQLHLSPAFIALAASAAVLVWVRPPVHEVLQKVEWPVLMFFAGLFVMVGGLEASGVLKVVSDFLLGMKGLPPVWFGILLIWFSAILSAIVDNVPITIALIPVLEGLESNGIEVAPLWWALVFGTGLGGNATIIGSTANIVVTTLSEETDAPITSRLWNKRGLPVMLLTCLAASILYGLFYSWMKN